VGLLLLLLLQGPLGRFCHWGSAYSTDRPTIRAQVVDKACSRAGACSLSVWPSVLCYTM
jgi:hypothetical protein